MDVCAENRGRLHLKVGFPAGPVMGRSSLTSGHLGVRVGNVVGNSDQKVHAFVDSSVLLKWLETAVLSPAENRGFRRKRRK